MSEKDEGVITSESLEEIYENESQEVIELEKIQVSMKDDDQKKANDNAWLDA